MTEAPSDLALARLLEEIKQWKQEEADRLEQIVLAAELEPAYAGVLQQWQPLLERTAAEADRLLEPRSEPQAAGATGDPAELLEAAAAQSGVLVQQLLQLLSASPALGREPEARSAVHEALRGCTARLARAEAIRQGRAAEQPSATAGAAAGTATDAAAPPAAAATAQLEPSRAESPPRTGQAAGAQQQVPIGGHQLPPLPYAYNALEPYIDEATMRIHHDKHHQAYVDDLNKAEKELQAARKSGDFALVKHWERELAFNGAGHYLHTLFWTAMSPQGGASRSGRWPTRSTAASAASTRSRSSSPRRQARWRAAAGRSSPTARAAAGSRSCRRRSTRTCPNGMRFRCCRSTSGSMPTTSSIRTSGPTTSRTGGTSSTGRT